ncbi:MAG TPA: hypothetical protein PKD55_19690 [Bellilinea sp.]|nr:hypothetical protein [Bellilinea sp.]
MTDYTAEKNKILAAGYTVPGAFAAGGAVTSVFTNNTIRDVDVYFKSREAFEAAVEGAYADGFWCVASSKRAVTFSDNGRIVQYMHFDFFPTADDIFAAFDFTVCMGAYDYDTQQFVFHPDFMKHNAQRFLRFNPGTRYPLASATRVLKYQERGYTIGKGDMMKIVLAARGVRIERWEDLKDQIGGAYGDKVVLGNEDMPFSLAAAIDALSVNENGDEVWTVPANDNQPSNSMALLRHLAEMKGEPFDESRFDDDGYLKAA